MKIMNCVMKPTLLILEKVVSELALLAAILSLTEPGTYARRIAGGMGDIIYAVYSFGRAFVLETEFRKFMGNLSTEMLTALGKVADNVEADPRKAFFAFIATFVVYKVIAYLLRLLRRRMPCRRPEEPGHGTRSEKRESKGKTYEQLYQRPEPRPHDPE